VAGEGKEEVREARDGMEREDRKGRRRGREGEGNLAPTVISKSWRVCFNAKWPLRVIQGHLLRSFAVNEKTHIGPHYILQRNNCGLVFEGSKKRSKNRHLRRPHSHLTPPLRTLVNIRINLILSEPRIPGLHFCC